MDEMNFPPGVGTQSMYTKICRCCLGKDGFPATSPDFNDLGKEELYENMLKDVFNIRFQSVELIAVEQYNTICEDCISRLHDASLFKDMVIRNEQMFLQYLQSQLDKEVNASSSELKIEEIKEEVAPEATDGDMKSDGDQEDNLDDDDEILANLKYEGHEKSKLENTNIQVNPTKKLKLKRCKKNFKDAETGKNEVKTKHIVKSSRGPGPGLRENSLKLLANSTAIVFQWNRSRYRCFCCKEPFSNIELLRTHSETHSLHEIQKNIIVQQNRLVKVEITNLNCKLCQKQLNNLDNLKEHLAEHDIMVNEHLLLPFKIEGSLKCQLCSEPFTQFRLLNIHMNKHYQKHVCYLCGAGFSNSVFYNLHRTRSHRNIECVECDVTFIKKTEKKQHDIQIHGVKYERKYRFPCPFCPERFFQESWKIKHLVEKHEMEKPEFDCHFCAKSFLTKSLVNNHVKYVHKKEKNYECDVCHKFFYTRSDVGRHKVSHTGEKNYSCSLCSCPFASKDSLRRHMKRTHAGH